MHSGKDFEVSVTAALAKYQNWLIMEQGQNGIQPEVPDNPLDWYTLTETANAILHELIAYTGREEIKERQKAEPDEKHIEELEVLFEQVHAINSEPMNFKNARRMKKVIDHFGIILMQQYDTVA